MFRPPGATAGRHGARRFVSHLSVVAEIASRRINRSREQVKVRFNLLLGTRVEVARPTTVARTETHAAATSSECNRRNTSYAYPRSGPPRGTIRHRSARSPVVRSLTHEALEHEPAVSVSVFAPDALASRKRPSSLWSAFFIRMGVCHSRPATLNGRDNRLTGSTRGRARRGRASSRA